MFQPAHIIGAEAPHAQPHYPRFALETLTSCPRPWTEYTEIGPRKNACWKRTCPYAGCREMWAKRESRRLLGLNRHYPFTHFCRFSPPDDLTILEKRDLIASVLEKTRWWTAKNGEWFDTKLYPENHGSARIHWNGPLRVSSNRVIRELRRIWRKETGLSVGSYSIAPARTKVQFLRYAVKLKQQARCQPVSVPKRRTVIKKGTLKRHRGQYEEDMVRKIIKPWPVRLRAS